LYLGKARPDNDLIRQSLSDGLHCPVIFDYSVYFSDINQWKAYSKYDLILIDYSVARFQTQDFRICVINTGIPVFFLFDTPDTAAYFELIDEGAENCIVRGDPQLIIAVYKTMKNRIILDRNDAESILTDKEFFTQEILDNLSDAFYVVDRNWCFTYINHKAETCWGRNRENLLGKSIWDKFPFIKNSPEKENHYTAMTQRIPMQWESSSLGKDFWLDIRVYPVSDGGLAVFFRDISEKKRAEDVLRLSRDKQAVMLRLSDSLRLLDNPSEIHEVAARIIGEYLGVEKAFYCDVVTVDGVEYFLLEKLYSVKDNDIFPGLHPIDSPGLLASENYEGRNIVVCDMETDPRIGDDIRSSLRKVGLGAWISVPLIRNGRFVAGFTVHQQSARRWTPEEISLIEETTARTWAEVDRVRAEAALRKSEQHALQLVSELENADRNKNDFINALSHELRNPLAAIVASLSMLDILDSNPNTKKAKQIIKRQTEQLCHLVDDLLDLARITNNKIQLNLKLFDLNELILSSAYDHRTLFEEKGIELITDISDTPVNIKSDPVRISQIVGNLLSNALKFTDKGGKTTLAITKQDSNAVIIVKDSGIGINPSFMPDLFKTFRQSDQNKGGLGLGLSIVKGLVELHGGSVSAESDGPQRGSTFTVRLPLPKNKNLTEALEMKDDEHFSKPLKILLIDDNRDLAETTCSLLTLYGYNVKTAYNGASGIQAAKEFQPHVILCDIGLPDMNGYEVARKLTSRGALDTTFLISLSGYAQASDFEYSKEAGFAMHISKPVDFEKLREILDSVAQ
jgi:PAS domain S-box-containing protein